ncbi:hypothetical protein [Streptomyces sp. NPDC046909]|uniref:hypothetical protein n=1 Tax=Streptomyces sp. NPDC046909 TaxID=3155617 RepID=UPI0033C35494
MGYVVLALLLIVGAAVAVVAQRRQGGRREPVLESAAQPAPVAVAAPVAPPALTPAVPPALVPGPRTEAERWVERLGAGLAGIDAAGDGAAVLALADATERYRAAKGELAGGRYGSAEAVAVEGLYYVRGARVVLGLDPGPALPALGTPAVTARDGRVIVADRTYTVSNRWRGGVTPYYYAGGVVDGRRVPGGWYSSPWWNPALAAA